jgi:hypothetical protein
VVQLHHDLWQLKNPHRDFPNHSVAIALGAVYCCEGTPSSCLSCWTKTVWWDIGKVKSRTPTAEWIVLVSNYNRGVVLPSKFVDYSPGHRAQILKNFWGVGCVNTGPTFYYFNRNKTEW